MQFLVWGLLRLDPIRKPSHKRESERERDSLVLWNLYRVFVGVIMPPYLSHVQLVQDSEEKSTTSHTIPTQCLETILCSRAIHVAVVLDVPR